MRFDTDDGSKATVQLEVQTAKARPFKNGWAFAVSGSVALTGPNPQLL